VVNYNLTNRLNLLLGISVILFLILWLRLFQLQILESSVYQEKSEANSIRVVEEIPGRGLICDRHGRVIVENRPSYSLSVIPLEASRNPNTFIELARIVNRPVSEIEEQVFQHGRQSYQPVKLARDIDFELLAAGKARALDLAGVSYRFEPKRFYAYSVAPHTLGYIAEISESEKKRFPHKKAGDIVGKSGVEKKYEDMLSGQKGYRYMIVNALGQITGELTDKCIPAQNSGKMYLTIDLDLQLLAEELLEEKRGAIVALDPHNGEILAIASSPKYDPEIFAGVLRSDDWKMLQDDPEVPLLHRATQSGYPAASTFKMVTMTAAIEEGLVDENYVENCQGSYYFGRTYHCFKRDGHGRINPVDAIEQSCDVFFYRLGHMLGVKKLAKYMRIYGFGSKTGIDIQNEVKGNLPDEAYLDKRYGEGQWSKGLAINFAIGQGELLVTPLQLARYCGILATKGKSCTPHVFKEMRHPDGTKINYTSKVTSVDIQLSTFDILREGMLKVIEGENGTAWWLKDERWHIAGKTGTAQNPHGEDHALFIGFAPFDDPVIAVAVVLENAGFGSTHAAPIAVKLMTRYLEICEIPELTKPEETTLKMDRSGDELQ